MFTRFQKVKERDQFSTYAFLSSPLSLSIHPPPSFSLYPLSLPLSLCLSGYVILCQPIKAWFRWRSNYELTCACLLCDWQKHRWIVLISGYITWCEAWGVIICLFKYIIIIFDNVIVVCSISTSLHDILLFRYVLSKNI